MISFQTAQLKQFHYAILPVSFKKIKVSTQILKEMFYFHLLKSFVFIQAFALKIWLPAKTFFKMSVLFLILFSCLVCLYFYLSASLSIYHYFMDSLFLFLKTS